MKKSLEKAVRKLFLEQHGKRAYNASITMLKRYGGGSIVLCIAGKKGERVSTELYIN